MKKTRGERAFGAFNAAFLLLLMVTMLYPLLYTAFASLSDSYQLMAHRGLLVRPLGLSTAAYDAVFKNPNLYTGYRSTLLYVAVGTSINLLLTSMAAYALALKGVKARDGLMFAITFTMMFSGGLIPSYIVVKNLGLMNTLWAVTLPTAVNTTNLIIMRTSFREIPESLGESAKIDGAGDFQIFARLYLPLSLPLIAVMVLFYGVGHWNSWFNASLYLRNKALYPLQLILREILIQNSTEFMLSGSGAAEDAYSISESIKYATIIVSTLPILLVYPLLQKYFIKGVMIGAIKG